MSQSIKCAVCSHPLEDALILACDHNLCLPCAAAALRRSQASGNFRGVTCQVCQTVTVVDPSSAAQLLEAPGNPPASSANPSYPIGSQPAASNQLCCSCETEVATTHCANCQEIFCDYCCSLVHRRGRFTNHTLQPFTSHPGSPTAAFPQTGPTTSFSASTRGAAALSNVPYTRNPSNSFNRGGIIACRDHPDENVQYFCVQCEQACICAECVIHGIHKDHEVLNIKKAYPAIRGKVEEFLYGIGSQVEEIMMAEQKVEQHRRELTSALSGAKQHLSKVFEEVRQKLTKKEHELQLNADAILAESLAELETHSRGAREKARGLEDNAHKIRAHMTGTDPVALLNYYAEVKSSLHNSLNSMDTTSATKIPDAAARRVVLAVEHAHAHAEALQSLHSAVSNIRGLESSLDDGKHSQPGISSTHRTKDNSRN